MKPKKVLVCTVIVLLVTAALLSVYFLADFHYLLSPEKSVENYLSSFGVNVYEHPGNTRIRAENITEKMLEFIKQVRGNTKAVQPDDYINIYFNKDEIPKIISTSKREGFRAPESFLTEQELIAGHKVYQLKLYGISGFSLVGISSPADFTVYAIYPGSDASAPDYAFIKAERLDGLVDILPINLTYDEFKSYYEKTLAEIDAKSEIVAKAP